ncbi:hypothetical protein BAUCODRAFT_26438 [Baudoinia panamericana UAMH 10762]|uniref:Nuclear condensin complex subunit 3 C-terminal domain-containing protein n=1 Tax=Baudoinia panamericana (strain UAMH 10762) TaxID=717646 RepID=M2MCL5_BAUPA|nr:uncharacterized protein BAUCODRAFT_26438 [Baudoinia panamericana UAMH 10762]EMC94276.1 hypothetical protein BAUCODRAFT_26438 [Baudoinia panamericana UAMH 10762]
MPGRVARKAQPANVLTEEDSGSISLRRAICTIFVDTQKSTAGHRKAVISLRKIQEACCYEPANYKTGREGEDFDEDDFNAEIVRCVLRIVPVRKAEPVGDRVVRFLGTFLNIASNKDSEIANHADPDASSVPETPTSRLTTRILETLLPLLSAKEKTIRFRATQITSHIINSLDTIDDNLFHKLRLALLKRIHDKEAPVRLQAVYGLGRLAAEVEDGNEQDESDSDAEVGAGVLAKLLNTLQHDPSAEVRRNLLLNLPLSKEVLPYLLERARDADASTRRALYARLLPALGDFRYLSLTHREKLLRWGLRDRDENVRKATARLFRERWIEDCAAKPAEELEDGPQEEQPKVSNQAADPSLDALLELLERIDVVNSGGEGGIAQIAMKEFWEGRPDYVEYVSFPDTFWEDLTPELAFVVRSFNDFCRSSGKEDGYDGPRMLDGMLADKLPEVTMFGFLLEREIAKLLETVQAAAEGEDGDAEEMCVQREFVVEQMLHMALTFDYSDEVGRRKMFALMREALAHADLPEEATRLVVEVLRLVCGVDAKGEREFCGVVVEAIAEVHDILGEEEEVAEDSTSVDDSFHSATEHHIDDGAVQGKRSKKKRTVTRETAEADEGKALREIVVNMKCLHIALCMLQNVQCELEENASLVTMLNNLVVPAVRSQEAPLRERGLCCLGLCCLLGKNLAEENLTLFLHCFAKGHPALQTIALQIIADILITHPSLLAEPPIDPNTTTATEQPPMENMLQKQVLKAFSRSLKSDDHAVQSTGATAVAKTMLSRLITDKDLLKQLVIAYFDPDTAGNAHLRQSLSYFLPVYCHSRPENAARMAGIATGVIGKLATLREAMLDEAEADSGGEGAEGEMVKLSVVGTMLVDWTDPRKIVGFAEAAVEVGAGETHFLLAEAVFDRLNTSQVGKEERKVLFGMLGKLHLPPGGCDAERIKAVLTGLAEASDVASDQTSRNTLAKMQVNLLKMIREAVTAEREVEDPQEENEDYTVTALEDSVRDITLDGMGMPDAEGTRVQLGGDADLLSEMEEEDTNV